MQNTNICFETSVNLKKWYEDFAEKNKNILSEIKESEKHVEFQVRDIFLYLNYTDNTAFTFLSVEFKTDNSEDYFFERFEYLCSIFKPYAIYYTSEHNIEIIRYETKANIIFDNDSKRYTLLDERVLDIMNKYNDSILIFNKSYIHSQFATILIQSQKPNFNEFLSNFFLYHKYFSKIHFENQENKKTFSDDSLNCNSDLLYTIAKRSKKVFGEFEFQKYQGYFFFIDIELKEIRIQTGWESLRQDSSLQFSLDLIKTLIKLAEPCFIFQTYDDEFLDTIPITYTPAKNAIFRFNDNTSKLECLSKDYILKKGKCFEIIKAANLSNLFNEL